MEQNRTYTLAELSKEFGLTERTARYYIEKVLPHHHKKGRGKLARYGQDTWNCFAFIKLARDRYRLGPSQLQGVLADIDQATVDRIVNGEEELAVMSVPSVPVKMERPATARFSRASERSDHYARKEPRRFSTRKAPENFSAFSRHADFSALDAGSDHDEPAPNFESPIDETWQTIFSDERIRIQHQGEVELSAQQEDDIAAAARLIRLALG